MAIPHILEAKFAERALNETNGHQASSSGDVYGRTTGHQNNHSEAVHRLLEPPKDILPMSDESERQRIDMERARNILQWNSQYVANEEFTEPAEAKKILGPTPEGRATRKVTPPPGVSPYLRSLYDIPLLTRAQEQHLFRKYNYLKHLFCELRARLSPHNPESDILSRCEALRDEAEAARDTIIQANLRLVVSIVRGWGVKSDDFFDRIGDGNVSLMLAVEKFDYSRGNKFSTYASWAIEKNELTNVRKRKNHDKRFYSGYDHLFDSNSPLAAPPDIPYEKKQRLSKDQIEMLFSSLNGESERNKAIIRAQYGIDVAEPQTHVEIAENMGMGRARVGQIGRRVLKKLRKLATVRAFEPADEDVA